MSNPIAPILADAAPDPHHRPVALRPLPGRPLMSVVITNYNYATYVGRAIESVQRQTYDRIEIIVVDDGSKDDSLAVIRGYAKHDARIRVVTKANGAMASSWNAAWPQVTGDVVCPLDADDAFHPDKLAAVAAAFAADAQAGLLIHAMTVVDSADVPGQRLPFLTRFERGWLADKVLQRGGRWRYMPTSALCFRREMGAYLFPVCERTFRMHADALVVTLLPFLTRVAALDESLSLYRVHGSNSLGGGARDAATAQKVIDFSLHTIEGVNARLAELGLPERLDVTRNLEYLQAAYVLALFDGLGAVALLRLYRGLAAALWRDDLYRPSQKMMGVAVYGVALLMPTCAIRTWWIGNTLGYSRFKRALQGAAAGVKGLFRRATNAPTTPRVAPQGTGA